MALLGMQDVSIAFGGPPVLDRASFSIERGERVCLIGRNGAGKSTIMKLLDGTITPDSGEIVRQTGVTVARLEQEIPLDVSGTIFDVVAAGLGDVGRLLAKYHEASHRVATDHSAPALKELDRLHHALDNADAWQVNSRVETVLLHLGLDGDVAFDAASGGRKRQTLLARALIREPDPRSRRSPRTAASVTWHRFDEDTFVIGRDQLRVYGELTVGIYNAARSIVDAFRLRHLYGEDQAVEAVRRWLAGRGNQPAELLDVARHFPTAEPPLRRVLQVLL